LNLKVEIKTAE